MEDKGLNTENEAAAGKINISKIAGVFLSRWYWIVSCVVIALAIAYAFLSYAPQIYSTSAILRLAENKTEFTELVNLGSQNTSNGNESEIFILKSQQLLENAVEKLDYPVAYYIKGRIKNVNVYPKVPFPVELIYLDSLVRGNMDFEISRKSSSDYVLSYNIADKEYVKNCKFGSVLNFGHIKFKVMDGLHMGSQHYVIHFNTPASMVPGIRAGLTISNGAKASSIMTLKMTGENPVLVVDVLNSIVSEYIKNDADRKRQAATQTINFIDGQLQQFSEQVNNSQSALQKYKKDNDIVNLNAKAQSLLASVNSEETKLEELTIERLGINQLESEINQNKKAVTLNLGLGGKTESLLSSLIGNFNNLIADRNIKIQNFDERSTVIQAIDEQIRDIRNAAINNIRLLKDRNIKTQAFLEGQVAKLKQDLKLFPNDEQNMFNLQSSFDVKQKIYSYLNEKKLESEISRAATVANASIVEKAKPNRFPISPIPANIYRNAVLLGLILGIGLIFLIRAINPYLYDHAEVEIASNVPILGMIKKYTDVVKDEKQSLTLMNTKSSFAEAIRSVRTNLSFMQSDQSSKIICITSEIAGEGKSFVSVNLSSSLCLIDKKVVLIAADLRRSRLHKTFGIVDKSGLSEYLSDQATLSEITNKTEVENLDFISSGKIPPNPSELLHRGKMRDLLTELKGKYDYVIVDTAPVGLISDAIPLIKASDINIFVVRSGVSKISAVKLPNRIDKEYKMNKSCIIMNAFEPNSFYASFFSSDVDSGNYNSYYYADYSYNSPYYDDIPEKPLWKRILGK